MKLMNENILLNRYIDISKWCCLLGKISQKWNIKLYGHKKPFSVTLQKFQNLKEKILTSLEAVVDSINLLIYSINYFFW